MHFGFKQSAYNQSAYNGTCTFVDCTEMCVGSTCTQPSYKDKKVHTKYIQR